MLFSKEYFLESLKKLNVAEEQIKTLGLYIKTFKSEYVDILECWEYIFNKSNVHHKLTLLYLVNEILQTDKNFDKDSLQLKNGFKDLIIKNFEKAKAEAKKYPVIHKKFTDLERVWKERHVVAFNDEFNMEAFFIDIDNCNGDKRKIIEILKEALSKLIKDVN